MSGVSAGPMRKPPDENGKSDQLITNQPKGPTEKVSEQLRPTKDEDPGEE